MAEINDSINESPNWFYPSIYDQSVGHLIVFIDFRTYRRLADGRCV